MAEIKICKAKLEDFAYIQEKVRNYFLDGTGIDWRQFFVGKLDGKTVAFGRILDHGDSFEIATLGVDYYHRKKGLGKTMLDFLVQQAQRQDGQKPIYGVTHLPDFVANCGFVPIKDSYPDYLDYKRKHVCHLDQSKISIVQWRKG